MYTRKAIAVAALGLAVVASVVSFGMLAYQLRSERSAAAVLIDTASVSQLNGFQTGIARLPSVTQMDVLRHNGFNSLDALNRTIAVERADLALAEVARRDDIGRREHAIATLLLVAALTCAATLLGIALVFDVTAKPKATAPRSSI
jgi:hypothetical protein